MIFLKLILCRFWVEYGYLPKGDPESEICPSLALLHLSKIFLLVNPGWRPAIELQTKFHKDFTIVVKSTFTL